MFLSTSGKQDGQKDKLYERQKDIKIQRQRDKKTERQNDRKTERQKDRKVERQKDRKIDSPKLDRDVNVPFSERQSRYAWRILLTERHL